MNAKSSSTTKTISTIVFILLIIGVVAFIVVYSQNNKVAPVVPVYAGVVPYEKVSDYNGMLITLSGNIIVPKTGKTCLSLGWSTCRLLFDNDPYTAGFGLHEVLLPLGSGPNSVTPDGKVYNYSGQLLPLEKTNQFDWYHVSINGRVSSCNEDNCLIIGDRVQGLK